MLAQGGGSIINLSSIWGSVAAPGAASYHASKAGVHHLTKNAVVTYAKQNVRVNSIHPGIHLLHHRRVDELASRSRRMSVTRTSRVWNRKPSA
jgi:NAD(P)-dependent dehydrogenase (short-subunit alcohol dehydrogenase family)